MHPNGAFDHGSQQAMLDFIAERSFGHIFMAGEAGLWVVHAPIVITPSGRAQFHMSRRNRASAHVAGNRILISVAGRDGYHSANWYASDDQVPTWLYEAVEIEGVASPLVEPELIEHLDRLSDIMEQRHSAEAPWTRAKMTPDKFESMIKAIVGFEVEMTAVRGTNKFNQHKSAADVEATIAGQEGAGRHDIAAAVHKARADS